MPWLREALQQGESGASPQLRAWEGISFSPQLRALVSVQAGCRPRRLQQHHKVPDASISLAVSLLSSEW